MARGSKVKSGRGWGMVSDPPSAVRLAKSRCKFMLENLHMIDYDLKRLVISAYLQGATDMAEAAFRNGFIPPGCEPIQEPFLHEREGI